MQLNWYDSFVCYCEMLLIQFICSMKVLKEYQTPSEKEFGRSFESALKTIVEYLQACRPVAVSVHNAVKHIRWQISQFPKGSTDEQVRILLVLKFSDIMTPVNTDALLLFLAQIASNRMC